MNYPQQQFTVLCDSLKVISDTYGKELLLTANIHTLHFFVYSQKNFTNDNANVKFVNGKRLFELDETFLLYPKNCNDNQIESAMNKALKPFKTL